MKAKPKSILSLLCLLAFTSFITGCGETVISEDQMQERGDLVFAPNQDRPFTGVVVKRYEDGEGWDRRYRDGIRHGRWTKWFPNGIKSEEFSYKEGKLDGKSTEWHRNGQKRSEGSYRNGKKNGKWTEWFENGQRSSVGSYKDGDRDGEWISWYENGQRSSVGSYKDGDRDGEWISWYENGQKKYRINYIKGTKDGTLTLWYENGNTYVNGAYKAGVENGEWTVWSDSGSKETEWTTKNGNPIDGKRYAWQPGFEQKPFPTYAKLLSIAEYKGGLRNGYFMKRDSSDRRVVGNFSQGLATGTWTVYPRRSDGRPAITGNYKDGKRDGRWTWNSPSSFGGTGNVTYVAGEPPYGSHIHYVIEDFAGSLLP